MSYFIAIRNPKNEKYELFPTIRDGVEIGSFESCSYSEKWRALQDCKYLIERYGKENVKLFENIPLDITTSVKIFEQEK